MIWLSGQIQVVLNAKHNLDLGVMCQPTSTAIGGQLAQIQQAGIPWAVDNEAFSAKFRPERWERWLRAVPETARLTCLFAVAPDVLHRDSEGRVYGDPVATLEHSRRFFPLLRELSYRVAFVSQDGATRDLIPWEEIGCLFVGGSDDWKLSEGSIALIREAQDRGLWTHMGRCQARGSIGGRIAAAKALGIDSSDGTVLAREPARIGRIVRGLSHLNAQMHLEFGR